MRYHILADTADVAIMARTGKEFESIFHKLVNSANRVELKVNEKKTKYIKFKERQETGTIILNVRTESDKVFKFKETESFNYLSVTVTN